METALVSVARVDGRIIASEFVSGISLESAPRLASLIGLVEKHADAHPGFGPLRALSISTTGTVDDSGTIMSTTSVPAWNGFALGRRLEERFGLPVRVENDINAAAFGEFALRVGEKQLDDGDDLLLVALSRSVLTGLVMGGRIHRGRGFNAGEVGLIVAEGPGPVEGQLEHAAEIIGSAAAVLDPSVIVIAVPMAQLPDAIGEINSHLRESRAAASTPLSFEGHD
nr:ROK family protein [Tessaracoccus coleopterorum]